MTQEAQSTIFILSDGTGETASTMIRAALVQYENLNMNIIRCKNVRTEEQIDSLLDDVSKQRGLIVFTMVSAAMSKKVTEGAAQRALVAVDLMGPLLLALDHHLGRPTEEAHTAGLLRAVDEQYFKRIEAIEYTVKHDDGKTLTDLAQADIVLVGVSRTSKTPLSIFLSHKGWKVANVPLVLGAPLPEELFKIDQRRIVGLTIDPHALTRIRKKRLEKFGQDPGGSYANMATIQKEMDYALDIFKQNRRWPVFDVTDRALEETAAEIVRVVASRLDIPFSSIL